MSDTTKPSPANDDRVITLTAAEREAATFAGISEREYAINKHRMLLMYKEYHGWGLRQVGDGRLTFFSQHKNHCIAMQRQLRKRFGSRKYEIFRIKMRWE